MEIPKSILKLNDRLRLTLGSTPFGEPIYKWAWTEDLYWPSMPTGQYEEIKTDSGLFLMKSVSTRKRMTDRYVEQWIIVRWCPIDGFTESECTKLGISNHQLPVWSRDFPGAPIPSRGGYYYHLANTEIPRGDMPTDSDTDRFIGFIKIQLAQDGNEHLYEWSKAKERQTRSSRAEFAAEIADSFTAYLKEPGKVDGEVSFGGVGESPLLQNIKSA